MHSKCFSFLFVLILLSLFLSSCNCRTELEGSWVGCEVRRPLFDWTLTIKDNHFSLVREDFNLWYNGFLKLNKNCRLKKIDLEIVDTAEQSSNGKMSLGIYEVDGDTLTIIASKLGDYLRPLSFDEPGKSREFYFTKIK
ncbi:hypothetical protein D1BOALGB6SA_7937 [Olavius sp. associated proteobacterium Delta 1]|nr:hypothetical protein D1BOALGB6SA_7937 [Olavius sp. associated proteobacterium Delta 1]